MNKITKHTLFIGLNDKDTKRPECYHNLFYARTDNDLKYKKDREAGSFDIWIAGTGVNVARSYGTIIANVDLDSRILLISWTEYSNTTWRQLNGILAACPSGYKIVYTDELCRWPDKNTIQTAFANAKVEARAYFESEPKITQRALLKYTKYKNNIYATDGSSDLYAAAHSRLTAYYDNLRKKARTEEKKLSEEQQKKLNAFFADVIAGTPKIIARAKHNFIEPEHQGCPARRVFVWDGKPESCIRTSGGVFFRLKDAREFAKFEDWLPGQTILGWYIFTGITRGADGVDVYTIGCHHIAADELKALRALIDSIKD